MTPTHTILRDNATISGRRRYGHRSASATLRAHDPYPILPQLWPQ